MKLTVFSLLFTGASAFSTTCSSSTIRSRLSMADAVVALSEEVEPEEAAVSEDSQSTIGTQSPTSPTSNQIAAIDEAFGISYETGMKCPPLGRRLLEDVQPSAIKWFQNAEIKHGRIAMVAVIGFINQKFGVHFPLYLGPTGSNGWNPTSDEAWLLSPSQGVTFSDIAAAKPLDAVQMVPMAGWVQILFAAGAFEAAAYQRQWVNGEGKVPGDYGYDPLGFTQREGGFNSDEITSLRMKEIKNGRVAMLTIAAWTADEAIPGAFPLWHP